MKKALKNAKKGVDKGPVVWYISKALDARGPAEAGQVRKHSRESKKGLDRPESVW